MANKTRIYFDCEFTGLHQNTTMISIGLLADNGDYFYAEFNDYDRDQINDWLKDNVLANLFFLKQVEERQLVFPKSMKVEKYLMCGNTNQVVERLKEWLSKFEEIEIWSDCLSYDWVLFNQLFGGALNIPKNIYYIPFDICTLFKMKNVDPDISREEFGKNHIREDNYFKSNVKKHNSLWDAYLIEACYNRLEEK
ncbi:Rnase H [Bacillus phage G]|uniref:Gp128 n=1 Tax=Bacillus phage G TaxID=2884420 RepID=G3MBJ0_9CAUD|nr:Rnase H [Bacillus phage G]AEO93390.1 gp128 [Bacillus phage G]